MNHKDFGSFKHLMLKYRRGDQIIHQFCRISCPKEINPPLRNLREFLKTEKSTAESCRMHPNLQIFNTEIQKGGPNNSAFLQNSFPPRNEVPPI